MKVSTDKGNDQRKYRLSLIKIQPNSLTYDKTEKKMKYLLIFECETRQQRYDSYNGSNSPSYFFPLVGIQQGPKNL